MIYIVCSKLPNSTILPAMAVSNTGITQLPTQKLLFFHLFMISVSFFLIFPCATSLSFNFTCFDRNKGQIYFEKDAFVSPDQVIQLTRNLQNAAMNYSWGRATYMKQLHLWDKVSGNLTDFTTSFTFVIDSQKNSRYGDGLAFFLAPNRAQLPSKMTGGSGLGIVSPSQALNTRKNRFVAVEFDTYRNDWDPRYPIKDHVGININSMKSVKMPHG